MPHVLNDYSDVPWLLRIVTVYAALFVLVALQAVTLRDKRAALLRDTALVLVCALIWARLLFFAGFFGEKMLQLDITCFYTGGEALHYGLSPYRTHFQHDPVVWDGISHYQHSRYVYPPIVANVFQVLAFLPYGQAKYVWMLVTVLCVAGGLWAALDIIPLRKTWRFWVWLAIAVGVYYPFFNELHTGQVDAVTFVFNMLGVRWLVKGESTHLKAGMAFVAATFFKLYSIYLLPFLFLQRYWRAVAGYVLGFFLLTSVSFGLNGRLEWDYWSKELPRISWIGEWGPKELTLSEDVWKGYLARHGAPEGQTYKHGEYYYYDYRPFFYSGSLAQTIAHTPLAARCFQYLAKFGKAQQGLTFVSWTIVATLFILIVLIRRRFVPGWERDPVRRFIYWQSVLIIVLLAGQRTWSMNTIWLLPVILLLVYGYQRGGGWGHHAVLGGSAVMMAIISIPDFFLMPLSDMGWVFVWDKYVFAQMIVLAALIAWLCIRPSVERNVDEHRRLPG